MSLVFDIGQGAGLAGASGVRPLLPPLLTGALASADAGIDFDGTDWEFLENPVFLAVAVALTVALYGAERSGVNREGLGRATGLVAVVMGALLFAGSMASGGHSAVVGLILGAAVAALGFVAVGGLIERARARLDEGSGGLLSVYADGAALAIAAVAIFADPLGFLAPVAFILLLVGGRREGDRKYAGLRVLR